MHQVQLLLECRRGLENVAKLATHTLTEKEVVRRQVLENGFCQLGDGEDTGSRLMELLACPPQV